MVSASLAMLAVLGSAVAQSASDIYQQIEALKAPKLDSSRVQDQAYVQEYIKATAEYRSKRNGLIWKLYTVEPKHEELPELMRDRWELMIAKASDDPNAFPAFQPIVIETKQVAEKTKGTELGQVAATFHLASQVRQIYLGDDLLEERAPKMQALFDAYLIDHEMNDDLIQSYESLIRISPSSEQAKQYRWLAEHVTWDVQKKGFLGNARRIEAMGKPFTLNFTDFLTGKKLSMEDFRGKIVLLDFWATWCGPCIGEFPLLKQIYEKHHANGFEIIGVSLDANTEEKGDAALREYLGKDPLPWTQYYQGNGWESEFSLNYGILAIPTSFIIDREGRLLSVGERGEDLARQIDSLMAK